jgi:hypothetical protein
VMGVSERTLSYHFGGRPMRRDLLATATHPRSRVGGGFSGAE